MKTIAQQLNVTDFPFEIKDSKGKVIYSEDSEGYWWKREYDSNGKETHYEESNGYWEKREYNSDNNEIYYEESNGFWCIREYNSNNNEIYFEDSDGLIIDNRSKELVLTMNEIADKFNINVKDLKIIK